MFTCAIFWPTQKEVNDRGLPRLHRARKCSASSTPTSAANNEQWNDIPVKGGELFAFDDASTYIQEPPFFTDLHPTPDEIEADQRCPRAGDGRGFSVTTDHISARPARSKRIRPRRQIPDGAWPGATPIDFNSYGSRRRGNDRVMTRGTFANIRSEESAGIRH